ncbi:MAG: hypothetical protein IJO48_01390 [Clostridia bacterium]|nr:hypothetical protein [Clostridia bacterium]
MTVFTLVGLALVGVSAAVVIKAYRPDIALSVSAALSIALLIAATEPLQEIFSNISQAASKYGIEQDYVKLILKIIGLSYLARFASDICNDSGETALGNKVELCGRLMIISVCVPVVMEILSSVSELMNI